MFFAVVVVDSTRQLERERERERKATVIIILLELSVLLLTYLHLFPPFEASLEGAGCAVRFIFRVYAHTSREKGRKKTRTRDV